MPVEAAKTPAGLIAARLTTHRAPLDGARAPGYELRMIFDHPRRAP